jgi:hypothetical protein
MANDPKDESGMASSALQEKGKNFDHKFVSFDIK